MQWLGVGWPVSCPLSNLFPDQLSSCIGQRDTKAKLYSQVSSTVIWGPILSPRLSLASRVIMVATSISSPATPSAFSTLTLVVPRWYVALVGLALALKGQSLMKCSSELHQWQVLGCCPQFHPCEKFLWLPLERPPVPVPFDWSPLGCVFTTRSWDEEWLRSESFPSSFLLASSKRALCSRISKSSFKPVSFSWISRLRPATKQEANTPLPSWLSSHDILG